MKSSVISLCLLIFGLSGCTNQPDGIEYIDLNDGDRQTYSIKIHVRGDSPIEGRLILRVDGIEQIDQKDYERLIITYEGIPGGDTQIAFARITENGLYRRSTNEDKSIESLTFPLPPDVGYKWSGKWDGGKTFNSEIASIGDCDISTKTFAKCVKIVTNVESDRGEREHTIIEYYAPNVGLVKNITTSDWVSIEFQILYQ